jgi:large subunit ribosomal protein L32
MAVPKKKVSKARRDKRRSSVWKLDAPTMSKCPKCGEYNLAYRVCSNCGNYKGETIVEKEVAKKA